MPSPERLEFRDTVRHKRPFSSSPSPPHNEIVLLHQYRYTVEDYCWEIPTGSVKTADTIEETVRAELCEKIGGATTEILRMVRNHEITDGQSALVVLLAEP